MNHSVSLLSIFILFAILLLPAIFWFCKYTGLQKDTAFLALLGSVIGAIVEIIYRTRSSQPFMNHENEVQIIAANFAAGISIVLLTAFAFRLWGRWIGDKATAEEQLPGQPGVRAWFGVANVVIGVLLVVCAWLGHDISPLFSALAIAALLAAYPLLRMETPATAAVPAPDAFPSEREKIVAMLEAGKITADECADLLQALGETSRTPMPQAPLTSGQRLLLIGAALVALGFFLPWIVIDPGHEAGRMMSQFGMKMGLEMPGGGGAMSFPNPQIQTPTVSYAGGDIARGLGWAALALALAAALLPYVATTLDSATSRTIRLLCLSVGGFIVLYLLTQNLRFVGIGLIAAVSGYILEIVGAMREGRDALLPPVAPR